MDRLLVERLGTAELLISLSDANPDTPFFKNRYKQPVLTLKWFTFPQTASSYLTNIFLYGRGDRIFIGKLHGNLASSPPGPDLTVMIYPGEEIKLERDTGTSDLPHFYCMLYRIVDYSLD